VFASGFVLLTADGEQLMAQYVVLMVSKKSRCPKMYLPAIYESANRNNAQV